MKVLIMAMLGILMVSGCTGTEPDRFNRRFPDGLRPPGNMSFEMSEENVSQVRQAFESAESADELSGYCDANRMLCGYYCRTINPEHEFCSRFNLTDRRVPI
jgi:hypothetical protein